MENLEQAEIDNPFDLEIKVQLIKEYRNRNAFVDAAQVKERYLEISPLPEPLWLEWLTDFTSKDLSLYQKSLKDFPCKFHLDPQVLQKLFSSHCSDLTKKIFLSVKPLTRDPDVWLSYIFSLASESETRSLFKQLFQIPRPKLESCWSSYESWEKDPQELKATQAIYLKSLNDWLQEFEISSKFSSLSSLSLTHLKTIFSSTKPSVHRFIYEEFLYRSPKSADIWEDYIISQINSENFKRVCKRSLRNSQNSINLWSLLLLCYDSKPGSLEKKVSQALSQSFEDAASYVRIWKEYSQALQRTGQDPISILVEGETWLKSYCPPHHLVLKAYRGNLTKDLNLFEEIVKEQSTLSSCWEVYIKFLENNMLNDRIREVYSRAVQSCREPEGIIEKFQDWEGKNGDLASIIQLKVLSQKRKMKDVEKFSIKPEKFKMKAKDVKSRFTAFISNLPGNVKEYQLDEVLRQIVRVKAVRIVRDRKGNSRGIAYCDFDSEEDLKYAVNALNGNEVCGNKVEVAISKPPEDESNEDRTVFVNNLPFKCSEEQIRQAVEKFGKVQAVRVIKNSEGMCKGFAYVEFCEKTSAELAVGQGNIVVDGRNVLIEKYSEVKEKAFVLHVSNLPFDVSEADLKEMFPAVSSVNCPLDRNGKTRGFGFLEFVSDADAQAVLEQPSHMMKGRYLVIKRSYKKAAEKKLNNSDFKKFLT